MDEAWARGDDVEEWTLHATLGDPGPTLCYFISRDRIDQVSVWSPGWDESWPIYETIDEIRSLPETP